MIARIQYGANMAGCNRTHHTTTSESSKADPEPAVWHAADESVSLSRTEIARRSETASTPAECRRWQVIALLADRVPGRDRGRDGLPPTHHPADRSALPRGWGGRAGGWTATQPRCGTHSHGRTARGAAPGAPASRAGWRRLERPEG